MAPESQTLFSITLFLALSSLLAWSHRRHRDRQWGDPIAATVVRNHRSAGNF
jgi:hypothetical protein